MPIQPLSGKYGKVRMAAGTGFGGATTYGVTEFIADNWDASINVEAIDTTNFGTGGWHDNIAGLYKADYTLSGPITRDAITMATMQTFPTEGDIVYIEVSNDSDGASPFTNLYKDEILVTSVKKTLTVKGRYEFEISGTSTVSGQTYTGV